MAALGLITATATSIVVLTVLRGLVLQVIWGWFIAKTFGITDLTVIDAIGVSMVVSFLTYQYDAKNAEADNDKPWVERLVVLTVAGVLINVFTLLTAIAIHVFQ